MDAFISLFHASPATVAALMAVSFIASVIDAIAGGGGLLNVPALMLAGFNPVAAVATNKVQGLVAVVSATRTYARAGLVDVRDLWTAFAGAFAGSMLGAISAQILPMGLVRAVVPFLLVAVALFVALSPKLTDAESRRRMPPLAFAASFAAGIGFYDGIFGPGAGAFFFMALIGLLGLGVTRAAANAKFLNVASNGGAFLLFALSGQIFWAIGIAQALASYAGAQIGARLALRRGASLIKPLVVIVCLIMAARLMLDPAHPLGAAIGIGR